MSSSFLSPPDGGLSNGVGRFLPLEFIKQAIDVNAEDIVSLVLLESEDQNRVLHRIDARETDRSVCVVE
jgi:hypothetical protein